MLIRSLLLRHGRIALARPPLPLRTWRRALTTETTTGPTAATPTDLPLDMTPELEPEVESAVVKNPFDTVHMPRARVQSPPVNSSGERFDIRDPDHPVARELQNKHHLKTITRHVGGTVEPDHYKPHMLVTNPPWPKDITLELLMASQAHIGHSTSIWHPANAKYIFGVRGTQDPIHIISLDITATYLRRACKIVQGVAEEGGIILFVGTRNGQARAIVRAAGLAKGCHLFTKWAPGTITNGQQILGKCQKKVVDVFDNEVPGFEDQLHDQSVVKPDLVVCLNPVENYILLHECGMNNIPTIGVVDTNCNPTWVTYPIPANDDSLRCTQLIAGVLGRAGQIGQANRKLRAQAGELPYIREHKLEDLATEEEVEVRQTEAAFDAAKEFAELDEAEYANLSAGTVWTEEAIAELIASAQGGADDALIGLHDPSVDAAVDDVAALAEGASAEVQTQVGSELVDGAEYPPETPDEASLRERLEEIAKQQAEEEKKP